MFFAQESVGGSTSPFFGNKSTSSCSLHWHTMLQATFSCWRIKFSGFSAAAEHRLRFCFPRWFRLAWSPIPCGLVVQLLTLRGQRLSVTDWLPAMAVMKSRLHHVQNRQRQASPPVFETWEFLILAGAKTPTLRGKKYSKTHNDELPIPILLLHSN